MIDFNKPMRRKEKEINDISEIHSILKTALVCRIGMVNEGRPYVVPMNFAFDENYGDHGAIYLHSAKEGLKLDILAENNEICFEVEDSLELVSSPEPCNWGMKYKSVIGYGKAVIEEDPKEKKKVIDLFMDKYSQKTSGEGYSFEYTRPALDSICLIRVKIRFLTGKKSGY